MIKVYIYIYIYITFSFIFFNLDCFKWVVIAKYQSNLIIRPQIEYFTYSLDPAFRHRNWRVILIVDRKQRKMKKKKV